MIQLLSSFDGYPMLIIRINGHLAAIIRIELLRWFCCLIFNGTFLCLACLFQQIVVHMALLKCGRLMLLFDKTPIVLPLLLVWWVASAWAALRLRDFTFGFALSEGNDLAVVIQGQLEVLDVGRTGGGRSEDVLLLSLDAKRFLPV